MHFESESPNCPCIQCFALCRGTMTVWAGFLSDKNWPGLSDALKPHWVGIQSRGPVQKYSEVKVNEKCTVCNSAPDDLYDLIM